jgi:glycosyltransferase involved in cell wall biosynthesis
MSQAVAPREERSPQVRIDPALAGNFSVVIPALNESENIPDLFSELEATFEKYGLNGEVIFVDDGSTDDSAEVALREGSRLKRFKLESHKRNLGKTEALVTGTRAAATDWIVLFDADLQHSPEEIPRLLEATADYDIVCGRKVGKYDKRLVSGIYNWLSRIAFHVPARDLNSIKIFRKEVLQDIQLRHDWHRFFVVLAHARGYKVGEIDVELYPRRAGETKYGGSGRVAIGLLDLVSVWFLLLFSRKPMMLFGFTGLLLLGLGLLVGVGAIVLRTMGFGFRPLLTLVVFLGVMGISLFGFGFIAEMIATLRAEVDDLRESLRGLQKKG